MLAPCKQGCTSQYLSLAPQMAHHLVCPPFQYGLLAVLEVYSDGFGPCKAINSTCKRLYFDLGDKCAHGHQAAHFPGADVASKCSKCTVQMVAL